MSLQLEDAERSGLYDTPQEIANRPGLDALRYRVGTYTSFRNTMLRRITRISVKIDDDLPDGTPNNSTAPLRTWSARDSDDYGIALLELWAYVADILTFYQERIANEAFIRTATQRVSLRRLAALLDYGPMPGVAASTYLVFRLKDGTSVELRAGLPLQHVPVGEEPPQKFETSRTLAAAAQWNQLTPKPETPVKLPFRRGDLQTFLAGTRVRIAPGDWVLIVGAKRSQEPIGTVDTSERYEVRQVVAVERLAEANETRVVFERKLGTPRVVVEEVADFFILRGKAALFGVDAPDWRTIPTLLRAEFDPPIVTGGASSAVDWPNREVNSLRQIDLHREIPTIVPDSWVVLATTSYREAYQVVSAETTARTDYTLNGQVTRLIVDTDENFGEFGLAPEDSQNFYKVRKTLVLHNSERVEVAERVTPIALEGLTLDVVEDVSNLASGRQILVYGPLVASNVQNGEFTGEAVVVREILDGGHTIRLENALQHSYVRAQTIIFANVVEATHGETIADEILGNGDPSIPFQSFKLKQSPLTYVPQAGAPGGAASTLELRINNERWHEAPTFYGRGSDEAIFTTEITDDQESIVRLGDGVTGALASSGRNNVTATYRKGTGRAGNLPAGVIKTLLERPKNLEAGHNPLPSSGGTEAEALDQIRKNAPNTVRTFGRIVSLRDFEDAARDFIGVAKARAFIEWDREWRVVKLVVAGDAGSQIVNPQYQTLVDDLNSRRDPNRKMTVLNYCPVELQMWLTLFLDEDFLPKVVEANVRAAIDAFFAFDRLELGESIALSELYHAVHQVDGVDGLQITRFRGLPSSTPCEAAITRLARSGGDLVQQVIPIAPYELARLNTARFDNFQISFG